LGAAIRCPHSELSEGDVMALPFSYEGKRVVVSGGGGAGMGAAAVEGLAGDLLKRLADAIVWRRNLLLSSKWLK